MSASAEKAKVLEYMRAQNRPYSIINIHDNLHGEIKKPDLQNILNGLVDDLIMKFLFFTKR